jgi:hypothetical protein
MSRYDGAVQGIAHVKPLRLRRNCRRCEAPVGKERWQFDWLCPVCMKAEQSPEVKRDLTRRSARPIR